LFYLATFDLELPVILHSSFPIFLPMTLTNSSPDRVLSIYLALTQYPILASRIRERMRSELFYRKRSKLKFGKNQ
jgi:hypothetical protein